MQSYDTETKSLTDFPTLTGGDKTGLSYSKDDRRIVSAGTNKKFYILNAKTGNKIKTYKGMNTQHYCAVKSAVYSPNGKYLVTLDSSRNKNQSSLILIRDANSNKIIKGYEGRFYPSLDISPNSKLIAYCDKRRQIHIHDLTTDQILCSITDPLIVTEYFSNSCNSFKFLSDSKLIYLTNQSKLKIYDFVEKRSLGTLTFHEEFKEWTFVTPEGFYDYSSTKAENYIYIRHKSGGVFGSKITDKERSKKYTRGLLTKIISN